MKQYIALFAFGFGIVAFAQHGPRPVAHGKHHHQIKWDHHRPHRPPVVVRNEPPRALPPKVVRVHDHRSTNVAVQLPNNVGIQVVVR